ncbi:MAG: hypothetical protein GAK34_02238 [Delftia tsuruhatensis]|nr:MAG: hypothetical protein GAK34_02238 [Delftia tsuruhatensis]
MAHGHAVAALDGFLEHVAEHAGLDLDDLALLVHGDEAIEFAQVQHDAAAQGQGRARDVAAPGRDGDGNGVRVGNAHHGLHLLHGGCMGDDGLRRGRVARGLGHHGAGPPVARAGNDVGALGLHAVAGGAQRGEHGLGHGHGVVLQAAGRTFGGRAVGCRCGLRRPARGRGGAHHVVAAVVAAGDCVFAQHWMSPIKICFSRSMARR